MNRVREVRTSFQPRLTQTALAQRIGIKPSSLAHIEAGRQPSLSIARDLALALEVSIDHLFGGEAAEPVAVVEE